MCWVSCASRAPQRPGGWETVGDIGWMDADGYLFLKDRMADMVLVGGRNVYPAEVEAAILGARTAAAGECSTAGGAAGGVLAVPAVRSCAVIGLPDDDLGNRVHAIVDVGGTAPLDERSRAALRAALEAHLERELTPYKRPCSYEFVASPVRDDAGKLRRSELRRVRAGAR